MLAHPDGQSHRPARGNSTIPRASSRGAENVQRPVPPPRSRADSSLQSRQTRVQGTASSLALEIGFLQTSQTPNRPALIRAKALSIARIKWASAWRLRICSAASVSARAQSTISPETSFAGGTRLSGSPAAVTNSSRLASSIVLYLAVSLAFRTGSLFGVGLSLKYMLAMLSFYLSFAALVLRGAFRLSDDQAQVLRYRDALGGYTRETLAPIGSHLFVCFLLHASVNFLNRFCDSRVTVITWEASKETSFSRSLMKTQCLSATKRKIVPSCWSPPSSSDHKVNSTKD
jgi:hypothetical protein